jgi:hypothetical protein
MRTTFEIVNRLQRAGFEVTFTAVGEFVIRRGKCVHIGDYDRVRVTAIGGMTERKILRALVSSFGKKASKKAAKAKKSAE